MTHRRMLRGAGLLLAVGTLLLPTLAGALPAPTTSHSGTVLAVDKAGGTVVLGELGPWRGATEVTRRTVRVTPWTELWRVQRATGAGPTGWIGEFESVRLRPDELKEGSYVTVQTRHEGTEGTALTITVVAPSEP